MKYIWLGIKDYCKDSWHDWLLKRLYNYYKDKKQLSYFEPILGMYVCVNPWKEGNLWHYIQQRQIVNNHKERKDVADKHNTTAKVESANS